MRIYKKEQYEIYAFASPIIDATTYCMMHDKEALLIDAVYSEELYGFLSENKIQKTTVLLTHGHYDHMLGIPEIKKICDVCVVCSEPGRDVLQNPRENLTAVANMIHMFGKIEFHKTVVPISLEPDMTLRDGDIFKWYNFGFEVIYTPGHSVDSVCYLLEDKILFVGDSLVLAGAPEFRYPGGDKQVYESYTKPILRAMPDDLFVFPGHEEMFLLSEATLK